MGIGKGSSKPPQVNPGAMANAQGSANKDAAITQARLNMVNQFTPSGSLNFQQTGERDGVPQFSARTEFSPMQDWLFRRGEDTSAHLLDLGRRQLTNLDSTLMSPPDFSGAPQARMPSLPRGVSSGIPQAVKPASFDRLRKVIGVPQGINLGRLPGGGAIPEANDAVRQRVEDALFQRMRGKLDPMFDDRQREMETQLVNQGFSRGGEGFGREQDRFRQDRDDAYQAALQDAIVTGGAEQSRLFGLEGQQFAMTEQQRQRALAEQLARFGVDTQRFGLSQAERQQSISELESLFGMRSQAFDQNVLRRQMQQADQAQRFGQEGQLFGLSQQARQQAIQEELLKRGVPLNELATIAGQNAGAALPQFSPVPQQQVAAPDVMGAMALQQQSRQNAWNQQQQNRQGLMGAVGNVAGAGLSAWMSGGAGALAPMAMSDPDMKADRGPVSGKEALAKVLDLPVEEWRYKNEDTRRVGPMATDWQDRFGGDGKTIDMVSAFGVSTAAIQELAKQVKRLERRAA